MRLLIEILVVAALIALGWEKSYRQTLGEVPVVGSYFASQKVEPKATARRTIATQPSTGGQPITARHSDSLFDPSHRTVLDKPIDPANKTFTGHILYKDEAGKSYWLDAQGQRHYEP